MRYLGGRRIEQPACRPRAQVGTLAGPRNWPRSAQCNEHLLLPDGSEDCGPNIPDLYRLAAAFDSTADPMMRFVHRMLWNGSSERLVQQLKEVAYSFERLR